MPDEQLARLQAAFDDIAVGRELGDTREEWAAVQAVIAVYENWQKYGAH